MNCIEILEKLVARESTNPGALEEGVAEDILALLKDAVSELSGTVEKVEVEAHRPILRVLLPGETKDCFSFICHMDTVPIGLHWEKNPFGEWEGSRLYGRGSCDMKGGTAAAISAFLQILAMAKKEKQKPKISLQMVFTCDEEGDMKGVEKAIQEGCTLQLFSCNSKTKYELIDIVKAAPRKVILQYDDTVKSKN